jgi:hypothetical protein
MNRFALRTPSENPVTHQGSKGLSELESLRLIKDLFSNTLVLCFNVNDIGNKEAVNILFIIFISFKMYNK